MITAHDLMTEDPVTVPMMAKVRDAVRLLQQLDVRHLPVVDEEGTLVGMLSDRDLRGLSFPEVIGAEYVGTIQTALDAPIASIMSSDVVSVDLEADVAEVIDLMLDLKIGAVPVVDTDQTHGRTYPGVQLDDPAACEAAAPNRPNWTSDSINKCLRGRKRGFLGECRLQSLWCLNGRHQQWRSREAAF